MSAYNNFPALVAAFSLRPPPIDAPLDVVERWGRHACLILTHARQNELDLFNGEPGQRLLALVYERVDARHHLPFAVWGGEFLPETIIANFESLIADDINLSVTPTIAPPIMPTLAYPTPIALPSSPINVRVQSPAPPPGSPIVVSSSPIAPASHCSPQHPTPLKLPRSWLRELLAPPRNLPEVLMEVPVASCPPLPSITMQQRASRPPKRPSLTQVAEEPSPAKKRARTAPQAKTGATVSFRMTQDEVEHYVREKRLFQARAVKIPCQRCANAKDRVPCLTGSESVHGQVLSRCIRCRSMKKACEWGKGVFKANIAYRDDPESLTLVAPPP